VKCVLLLGYSTTGKSTILCDFREKYAEAIETVDSDSEISKEDGGHIYNVFLRFVEGSDTGPALREIERRERQFLERVGPNTRPLLIAAGPCLPIREPEWREFVQRVQPICFYLQKPPEKVLQGLRDRHAKHLRNEQLAGRPGFGCWDQDLTTECRNGRWVEVDDSERALQNVRANMQGMVRLYERLASQTFLWEDRQTTEGKQRLYRAILSALNVSPVAL